MPDAAFDDAYLASLYDALNYGDIGRLDGPDDQFYLALARDAAAVLDIGCGTGVLLHELRRRGHAGRLVGIDPAAGMIARARRHPGIEWVHGYATDPAVGGGFDLAMMTGHAFQALTDADATRALLAAARRALLHGGTLAFETRNRDVRAWRNWTPEHARTVHDPAGHEVRVHHEVLDVEEGDHATLVSFIETFEAPGRLLHSRTTLRFPTPAHLDDLLTTAGFAVTARYGDWDRSPLTRASPEIITLATAV